MLGQAGRSSLNSENIVPVKSGKGNKKPTKENISKEK